MGWRGAGRRRRGEERRREEPIHDVGVNGIVLCLPSNRGPRAGVLLPYMERDDSTAVVRMFRSVVQTSPE